MAIQLTTGAAVRRRPLLAALAAALLAAGCGTSGDGGGGGGSGGGGSGGGDGGGGPPPAITYREVIPQGDTLQGGIFDPSLAYDRDGTGWLAYTSVEGPNGPGGPATHTHLASSADRGLSWTYRALINASIPGEVVLPDGKRLPGIWRTEVPVLVHEPGDARAPWKQFAHRYFWNPERDRMADYGWIAMRTASAPTGPWSEEIALFGAGDIATPAGPVHLPRVPYDQQRIDLNDLHPDLATTIAYSEPGALVRDGVLWLSLVALSGDGPHAVILLASDDHGDHWRFVSTLATNADARRLGFIRFDGSALATHGGEAFLLVTPQSDVAQHDGTLVLPFADLAAGRLRRSADGVLAPSRHVPNQRLHPFGGGQSTYHELNLGGLMMPQLDARTWPRWFRIYDTGVRLGTPSGSG